MQLTTEEVRRQIVHNCSIDKNILPPAYRGEHSWNRDGGAYREWKRSGAKHLGMQCRKVCRNTSKRNGQRVKVQILAIVGTQLSSKECIQFSVGYQRIPD